MQLARCHFALCRRRFGRGPRWITAALLQPPAVTLSDDLKLFATTFAAGFLFVSILIA